MNAEIPHEITVQRLSEIITAGSSLTILDVREPKELAICKFENSLDIPMQNVPANLENLRDTELLVVVCHSGMRSWQVTQWLRQQGIENAPNLDGGIDSRAREIDTSMSTY